MIKKIIASVFHTNKLISMWNTMLNTANTGTNKLTLWGYMLGTDVAFLAIPSEPFHFCAWGVGSLCILHIFCFNSVNKSTK